MSQSKLPQRLDLQGTPAKKPKAAAEREERTFLPFEAAMQLHVPVKVIRAMLSNGILKAVAGSEVRISAASIKELQKHGVVDTGWQGRSHLED